MKRARQPPGPPQKGPKTAKNGPKIAILIGLTKCLNLGQVRPNIISTHKNESPHTILTPLGPPFPPFFAILVVFWGYGGPNWKRMVPLNSASRASSFEYTHAVVLNKNNCPPPKKKRGTQLPFSLFWAFSQAMDVHSKTGCPYHRFSGIFLVYFP